VFPAPVIIPAHGVNTELTGIEAESTSQKYNKTPSRDVYCRYNRRDFKVLRGYALKIELIERCAKNGGGYRGLNVENLVESINNMQLIQLHMIFSSRRREFE
jgi:hypothetical protein